MLPIAAALEQDCHCDALKRVGPDGRKEGERVSEEPIGALGLLALPGARKWVRRCKRDKVVALWRGCGLYAIFGLVESTCTRGRIRSCGGSGVYGGRPPSRLCTSSSRNPCAVKAPRVR